MPLGLAMLEQGWITPAQLRGALEAQTSRRRGTPRPVAGAAAGSERAVGDPGARACSGVARCWALELHDAEGLTALLPRLFVDAFGALPLRVAAGKILYMGFEARLDPVWRWQWSG